MENKKNVPEIRFKGFAEEWNESKMGRIGIPYNGLSGKTKDDFGHGDAKFITYMNVFSNPVSNLSQTENVEIDNKQNSVKYGDILFTVSSETPDEVGMSSVWLGNEDNIYLNSFCFGYRLIVHKDPYYMAYVLRSKSIRKLISLLAQGISRYNISKGRVMEIALPFPDNNEQKAIGNYFQNIDKLIVASQEKLDKLKTIKKACLEKMFPRSGSNTPEIRFKGFTEEWREINFEDLYNIASEGGTPSTNVIEYYQEGNIPFVKIEDTETKYISRVKSYISETGLANSSAWIIPPDSIIFTNGATVGNISINTIPVATKQGILGIVPKDIISTEFMYYLLSNDLFQKEVKRRIAKGTFDTIILKNLNVIIVAISFNEQEQKRISIFLHKIDDLIFLTQQKIEKLRNIKKACLNKMFVNTED